MKTQINIKAWNVVSVCILALFSITAFGLSGSGTEGDPYLIENLVDFGVFADPANAATYWASGVHTKLAFDPNLAGTTYPSAVIAPDMDHSFKGVFDGNDHVVSNLTIDDGGAGNVYLGLFGFLDYPGELKNLSMVNVSITGDNGSENLGSLCGYSYGGTIRNCNAVVIITGDTSIGGLCGQSISGVIADCHVTGTVSGSGGGIGGLCGQTGDVGQGNDTITNCYAAVTVTGGNSTGYLGGLVGANGSTFIIDCYATGSVTGGNDSDYLGGLCGYHNNGSITNCYATVSVTGGVDSAGLGGLCGVLMSGNFTDCYATGVVGGGDGSLWVGGLCGLNGGNIANSYAMGTVSGSIYLGGLVGISAGSVTNCFWDAETSGISDPEEGMPDTDGMVGLPTDPNMWTQSTFTSVGWDFVGESANGTDNHWRMCVDGVEYPMLAWQSIMADLACPDGVDLADFAFFASRWLEIDCDTTNNCGGADMDRSTDVGLPDLQILCNNWLAGI